MARLYGLFDGLWLGLLDWEALALLDERLYEEKQESVSGERYRYVDDEYTRSGLHEWESAAVEEHFPAGGRIVVPGAGGGREVLALLERGFDAVGYEPNAGMVEAGRDLLDRLGYPNRLHLMERDAFPECSAQLDAVVVGWGSYMHIPGRSRRVAFLRDAHRQMRKDAPLLVSFFERPPSARYFLDVARVANAVRRLRRRERVELGDALTPNYYAHHFTRDDIDSELEMAGFRVVTVRSHPYAHALARAR